MTFILRDKDVHGEPCALITTKTSTKEDVEEAIAKVHRIECYDSDDLEKSLPKDCNVTWIDSNDEVWW